MHIERPMTVDAEIAWWKREATRQPLDDEHLCEVSGATLRALFAAHRQTTEPTKDTTR